MSGDSILLSHPAQGVYGGLHVIITESHHQAVVLNANLVNGLPSALLQPPLQLCGQVLKAVLCWVHQLQLRMGYVSLRTCVCLWAEFNRCSVYESYRSQHVCWRCGTLYSIFPSSAWNMIDDIYYRIIHTNLTHWDVQQHTCNDCFVMAVMVCTAVFVFGNFCHRTICFGGFWLWG